MVDSQTMCYGTRDQQHMKVAIKGSRKVIFKIAMRFPEKAVILLIPLFVICVCVRIMLTFIA